MPTNTVGEESGVADDEYTARLAVDCFFTKTQGAHI